MTKQLIAKVYTNFFRNEVNGIIDFRERSEIIEKTLKLLSKDKLTDIQKKSIYEIVMNYNDCSDIHKVRFNLYYGLDPNYNTRLSIADISKILKISTSSVRGSVNMFGYKLNHINESEIYVFQKILDEYYANIGIRIALIRMENEDIFILKNILDECIKQYDIKFIEK